MARCNRCRTNNHDFLYSFGGASVCFSCYDMVNPNTITYKLLDKTNRDYIESRIIKLTKELRDLQHRIDIDNKLIQSNQISMTAKIPRTQ